MIPSKAKQLLFVLKAGGPATLPYPFEPRPAQSGFRGKVTVNTDLCVGCGGCAAVCPARVIRIIDVSPDVRIIRRYLTRCILCGRCADVCSEKAVTMTTEYETATPTKDDLFIEQVIYMGTCGRCGRCYKPPTPLDRLMKTGFRQDEPFELRAKEAVLAAASG